MASLKRYWLLAVVPIAILLAGLLAVRIVGSVDYHHNDNDFFTFWLAGHLMAHGGSPYDPIQWLSGYHQFEIGFIPNQAFLYPLPMALLMIPLGLLPLHSAYVVWVTLIQLMIFATLILLLFMEKSSHAKLFFIPLLAGIVLFRPTILTLIQGQMSGLFLILLVWMAYRWERGKWFQGGLLLGFLVLKPNLGVLIILLLAIWLLLQKHWLALLGTVLSMLVLLAAGLIYNPTWISQYWQIGNNKLAETFGGSPTVWGLGALISHYHTSGALIFGSLASVLILFLFFWVISRLHATRRPINMIGLVICITLLMAPYTWTYDQLLLVLPICTSSLALDRLGAKFALTAAFFLGVDLLAVILLFFDTVLQVEILNVFIPAGVFALGSWLMKQANPAKF